MTHKILTFCFYLLFFLTPLIWIPLNYELFEYNKMIFVYFLTVIIVGFWVIRMVREQKLFINKTPLDIPILLFLAANILSTVFSIDSHTSIWGYYSRSNGGLLSIISYTMLYFAFVSNFQGKDTFKFLKAALLGGLVVSLYAIPEHFGVSPSCVVLTQRFSADCWVQDVQARVFATLGQPNWLAAYLAMLIFPALYFFLTAKTRISLIAYSLQLFAFYMAFTFTYSRGATLGLLGGLGVFLAGYFLHTRKIFQPLAILVSFIIINLLFGSALTGDFRLIKEYAPPRPVLTLPSGEPASPAITQLEAGGTESGQIRLIVWRGAWEIFKHYIPFGSGVETFAYSYYNFRPIEHNMVSEWDFLYNKAHNEYLNYLATTGIVGLSSYLIMIITFITVTLKRLRTNPLLLLSILASYITYLIQNFFGFSVVVIALFFYLFPALSVTASDKARQINHFALLNILGSFIRRTIFRRPIYQKGVIVIVVVIIFVFLYMITRLWVADTLFARGTNYSSAGNPGRAYNDLIDAVSLNSGEPFYRNELGFAAASAALVLSNEDATLSAQLRDLAVKETDHSLSKSPHNVSFLRTAIRTYYTLAQLDPLYNEKTLQTMDMTIALAPTDANLYYNKALILGQLEKNEEGAKVLEKAVELKPNYRDAHFALGVFYETLGEKEKAKAQMEIVLKLIPNDPDALKKLEELKKT